MMIIAALIGAAIIFYILDQVFLFVAAHLAVIVGTTVIGGAIGVILLRKLLRAMAKHSVKAWPEKPVKPPRKPPPALPEPFTGSTAEARPFTMEIPDAPTLVADATLLACEGPGCTHSLHTDPALRWRCGTGTAPPEPAVTQHGGGGGGTVPLQLGDVHEFCSEACMTRFIAKEDATPAPPG